MRIACGVVVVSLLAYSTAAVAEDWKNNCQVIEDYGTQLQFTVNIQPPRSTGTNKEELTSLLSRLQLDGEPQLKKGLAGVTTLINRAKPFKGTRIPGYSVADMTVSPELNNKIKQLFEDITTRAKKSGAACGAGGG